MRTTKDPKTTRLQLRVNPVFAKRVRECAERQGVPVAVLIRRAIDTELSQADDDRGVSRVLHLG